MIKYNTKKIKNQGMVDHIVRYVSESTLNRMAGCNSFMTFIADGDLVKKKQVGGNSCKNRFCLICAWRKARKDALKISVLMKFIEIEYKKKFIFVTLTAPNVKGENLSQEITRYNKAFKKMVERNIIAKINQGYIRKLEVTYNAERDDYHPHFHVVFAVNQGYFAGHTYVKQEKWLNLWRDVMDAPEITQVDVRKYKKHEKGKEVNEIATYAAKSGDLLINQDVFDALYSALRGRQILTYNGLFAEASRLFRSGELEKYKKFDETEYAYHLLYHWGFGEYVEAERRELTEKERKKYNRVLIEEIGVENDEND